MKKLSTLMLIILSAFLLISCEFNNTDDETNPSGGAKMVGVVTEVSDRIAILVTNEEYKDEPMHVLISDKTAFFDSEGNKTTIESIQVGDSIVVTYNGQVMMSYPGQISAIKIEINEMKDEEQNVNPAKMTGVVTDVGDKIAILVTEGAYKDQPIHVLVNDSTTFLSSEDTPTTKDSVKVGDTIVVAHNGQVMMSYPGQISAIKIEIK